MPFDTIRIDADAISDWPTFHAAFAKAFGFPGFYGNNMDAWIDCLTSLDDRGAGMTTVHVDPGGTLALVIDNAAGFKRRCPEQFDALVSCAAFVNWRRIEAGESAVLALAFYS